MRIICLDPEMEFEDLTNHLGGCFIDLMTGEYIINVLEPKTWDEAGDPKDAWHLSVPSDQQAQPAHQFFERLFQSVQGF